MQLTKLVWAFDMGLPYWQARHRQAIRATARLSLLAVLLMPHVQLTLKPLIRPSIWAKSPINLCSTSESQIRVRLISNWKAAISRGLRIKPSPLPLPDRNPALSPSIWRFSAAAPAGGYRYYQR